MVKFLQWMYDEGDRLADKPNLGYFLASLQFDGLWFVDHDEYWNHDWDFEMCMHTNCRLTKMFVGRHYEGVFAFITRDHPVVYVLEPSWWICWKPSDLLLVPSASVFAYSSGLILCGSEVDKAHI